jgi:spore germination cell wall hydrolase CwlJ-like protein
MDGLEKLLACVAFAETKDLDDALGVMHVIMNRAKKPQRFGASVEEVIYRPHQFAGVNSKEWEKAYSQKFVNKEEENIYKRYLSLAYQVSQGKTEDPTGGADHYVNLKLAKPNWAKVYKKTGKIGEHTYFAETFK